MSKPTTILYPHPRYEYKKVLVGWYMCCHICGHIFETKSAKSLFCSSASCLTTQNRNRKRLQRERERERV